MAWNYSYDSNFPASSFRWNYIIASCFKDGRKEPGWGSTGATCANYLGSSQGVGSSLGLAYTQLFLSKGGAPNGTSAANHLIIYDLASIVHTPIGARLVFDAHVAKRSSYTTPQNAAPVTAAYLFCTNTTGQTGYGTSAGSLWSLAPNDSSVTANQTSSMLGATNNIGVMTDTGKDVYLDDIYLTNHTTAPHKVEMSFFLPASNFVGGVKANLSFRQMLLYAATEFRLYDYGAQMFCGDVNVSYILSSYGTNVAVTYNYSSDHRFISGQAINIENSFGNGGSDSYSITGGTVLSYSSVGDYSYNNKITVIRPGTSQSCNGPGSGTIKSYTNIAIYAGTDLSAVEPDNPPADTLLCQFNITGTQLSAMSYPGNADGSMTSISYPTATAVASGTAKYAVITGAQAIQGKTAPKLFMPVSTIVADNVMALSHTVINSGQTVQLSDFGFHVGMW